MSRTVACACRPRSPYRHRSARREWSRAPERYGSNRTSASIPDWVELVEDQPLVDGISATLEERSPQVDVHASSGNTSIVGMVLPVVMTGLQANADAGRVLTLFLGHGANRAGACGLREVLSRYGAPPVADWRGSCRLDRTVRAWSSVAVADRRDRATSTISIATENIPKL